MELKTVLFLSLTFTINCLNAQHKHDSKSEFVSESQILIQGMYEFTYLETTHQIKLSSLDKTFYEYDEYGTKLGSGKFTKEGNYYLLMPEEISTYSMINGAIEIELLSLDEIVMKVNLMLSDTISEELELIKQL